jgi:hypothetical protein
MNGYGAVIDPEDTNVVRLANEARAKANTLQKDKFKVGDKVYLNDDVTVVHTIVFISDVKGDKLKYLCVYQNCHDTYSVLWVPEYRMILVPKFKVGEVWKMRDGDHAEIVSMCSRNLILVHNKNTEEHGTVGLDLNGRYYENGTLSDYDLVEKVDV